MAKDIEPKLKLIKGYLTLEEGQKFQIPEYQRGYSWRIEHCDKLWQDIEQFIESETDDPYFFGTVILDCSSDNAVKNDRVLKLIDGQQRTTTFLLLLKALYLRLQNALENFGGYDEATEPLRRGMQKRVRMRFSTYFTILIMTKRSNLRSKRIPSFVRGLSFLRIARSMNVTKPSFRRF